MTAQLNLFDIPAPPPALPRPFAAWDAWTDGGRIVVRHPCGVRLAAATADEADAARRAAHRWCEGLHADGWSAFHDAGAEGRADLHPWTAIHQDHDAVSAPTLPELAWWCWWAAQDEQSLPDLPEDLLRALFLAGWRWDRFDFVRGAERAYGSPDELWYLATKGLKG